MTPKPWASPEEGTGPPAAPWEAGTQIPRLATAEPLGKNAENRVRSGFGLLLRQAGAIAHLGDDRLYRMLILSPPPVRSVDPMPLDGPRTGHEAKWTEVIRHPRGQDCAVVENAAIDDTGPLRTLLAVHHGLPRRRQKIDSFCLG